MSVEVLDRETETAAEIATAAYTVWRRYKTWAPLVVLRRAVDQHLAQVPELAEEDPRRLRSVLRRVAERRARECKARKCGYHPDDEAFYPPALIVRLLPYALDDTPGAPTAEDQAELTRRHGDKAGYGGWEAALADIRRGLARLRPSDRALLVMHHQGGVTPAWLAEALHVHPDTVRRRLKRAVARVQRELGGAEPRVA